MSGSAGRPFVLAVDAGGTHTRVGCFSPDGHLLARATGPGGSPNHNDDAREHVTATMAAAFADGGLRARDAIALGRASPLSVGPARIRVPATTPGSGERAVPALCRRRPAPRLRRDRTTADRTPVPRSRPGRPAVLDHWGVDDVEQLRRRLLDWSASDGNDRKRRYGALAPAVTALADRSEIADVAVRSLAFKTAQGVRLLAPLIGHTPTPVALVGGLATDPAFESRLQEEFGRGFPPVRLTEAAYEPLGGAAVIAFECAGISVDDQLLHHLRTSSEVQLGQRDPVQDVGLTDRQSRYP